MLCLVLVRQRHILVLDIAYNARTGGFTCPGALLVGIIEVRRTTNHQAGHT